MTYIEEITFQTFETPLHNSFVTARGSSSQARAVAVTFTLEDGASVRGECVPVTYVTGETRDSVLNTFSRIRTSLLGKSVQDYGPLFSIIGSEAANEPSARCGLEMAALQAWSHEHGISLRSLWGGSQNEAVTDITIPIVPEAAEIASLAYKRGIRFLKVKVGEADKHADISRVLAVSRSAPQAVIRLDANQGFEAEEVVPFIEQLLEKGIPIELLEQPVRKDDFEGLARVAETCPIPVFADESCCSTADALLLASSPVHGFNLKLNKSGIQGSWDIAAIARAAGKKLMIGCMLETRFSISVSLAFACGLGGFSFLDLDGHMLLKEDGDNLFFNQSGGRMFFQE